MANKAQSQKGEIANKIIKQHTRLIRISGKGKGITMSNVPVCGDSLCNNEVFILDMGPVVYQWDGETAGIFLKNKVLFLPHFLFFIFLFSKGVLTKFFFLYFPLCFSLRIHFTYLFLHSPLVFFFF